MGVTVHVPRRGWSTLVKGWLSSATVGSTSSFEAISRSEKISSRVEPAVFDTVPMYFQTGRLPPQRKMSSRVTCGSGCACGIVTQMNLGPVAVADDGLSAFVSRTAGPSAEMQPDRKSVVEGKRVDLGG